MEINQKGDEFMGKASCESCPAKDKCTTQETCKIENNPHNSVKKIIGVMSGKGGVGKSTLSALIAEQLNRKGYKVGVLDADITGPSIPRLLSVKDKKAYSNELGIIPVVSPKGIKVMSLNLLMEDEGKPVIWRGPLIGAVVKQFWTDVIWGELDYLIIDMPPGTGDVALTVMQYIPINGIVMVSVPQDLVSMIVAKAVNMVKAMKINIIGVIENMSYVLCPDCNKKIYIFHKDDFKDRLKDLDVKLLGQLPMSKALADVANGRVELDETIEEITEKIISLV